MDVILPNGVRIQGIPDGTSKEEIKRKAIAAGLATEADFAMQGATGGAQSLQDVPGVGFDLNAQVPEQPSPGLADRALGVGEALLSTVTGGALGMPAAALGAANQMGQEILSGEFGTPAAADRITGAGEEFASNVTYQPRTETGQDIMQTVGEIGEQLPPFIPPAVQAAPALSGARLARTARAVDGDTPTGGQMIVQDAVKTFAEPSPVKQAIIERIQRADPDPDLAPFKVEQTRLGQLTGVDQPTTAKDAAAVKVLEHGFDPGVIQPVKNQNVETQRQLRRMAMLQQKALRDKEFGMLNRPSDVAGDVFKKRFDKIVEANKAAGKEVDRIAKQDLRGQRVELANIGDEFQGALDNLFIEGVGDEMLDFSNSALRGLPELQKPIQRVYSQMLKEGDSIDALGLHQFKRQIDNMVSYGTKSEGLSGDAERVLKGLRANINQQLRDQFPQYENANRQYSDTIVMIDELQRLAPNKLDFNSPSASSALGTLLRRLMGNAQSRVPLLDLVDSVESYPPTIYPDNRLPGPATTASPVNLKSLILFADELDSNFGAAARTSLQGEFDKTLSRVMQDAETRGAAGIGDYIDPIRVGGKIINKIRDDDNPAKLKQRQYKAQMDASFDLINFLEDQINVKSN